MLNATPTGNERNIQRVDRRKPDPSALQAWEALDATEAELCATRAKLASANEALEAAREREDRLLKMLEKRQIRLPHLVVTAAATAVITVILALVGVAFAAGTAPAGGTPRDLAVYHAADCEKWGKVVSMWRCSGNLDRRGSS